MNKEKTFCPSRTSPLTSMLHRIYLEPGSCTDARTGRVEDHDHSKGKHHGTEAKNTCALPALAPSIQFSRSPRRTAETLRQRRRLVGDPVRHGASRCQGATSSLPSSALPLAASVPQGIRILVGQTSKLLQIGVLVARVGCKLTLQLNHLFEGC